MDFFSIIVNLGLLYLIITAFKHVTDKFTQSVQSETVISELNKKNFKMIGSTNCTYCHKQLSELKVDWDTKILNVIDCANNPEICSKNPAITGFPSWISGNGKVYPGFKTLRQLETMTKEN
tara:strand:+ start:2205 stop:2567 length:363 start_codon:yes stop_codon:yes gene_type:complete